MPYHPPPGQNLSHPLPWIYICNSSRKCGKNYKWTKKSTYSVFKICFFKGLGYINQIMIINFDDNFYI